MEIFSSVLIYQEFFKMLEERLTASMARIKVEHPFCNNCSVCIKKELQEIEAVTNIRLCPKESLVTFNFIKADKLSTALNILSDIGYPEKGERLYKEQFSNSVCRC
jgi:copper chaperone CopZ